MNKTIDLDRLHACVEQINTKAYITVAGTSLCSGGSRAYTRNGRLWGISAGYVELMVAEALLGQQNNSYVYIGESQLMAEKVLRHLYDRLVAEQVEINSHKRDSLRTANDITFVAVNASQVPSGILKGRTIDRVFCDVDLRNRTVDFVTQFNRELLPLLQHTTGDIV